MIPIRAHCQRSPGTCVFECMEAATRSATWIGILACALLLLSCICACSGSEAAGNAPPGAPPPAGSTDERFLARPDGTALDRRTGVIWQRCRSALVLDDG